jgi:hypothetical protein
MELWEFLLVMTIAVPIVILWLGCIIDVVGRPDISGWMKAGWMLIILAFPIIGAIVYTIARPKLIAANPEIAAETYSDTTNPPPTDRQTYGPLSR